MKPTVFATVMVLFGAMSTEALAETVDVQCVGFPKSSWSLLGNNVSVDNTRKMIKSLDSGYQWISASFGEDIIQWVSHGSAGDGTSIQYIFTLGRANLMLTQVVSANGRAVYTGRAQCQIVQSQKNKL